MPREAPRRGRLQSEIHSKDKEITGIKAQIRVLKRNLDEATKDKVKAKTKLRKLQRGKK